MNFHIVNRHKIACGYIPVPNLSVLISITTPDLEHPPYNPDYLDVLQLKFHDIDTVSTQSEALGLKVISKDDVQQIYEFVNSYKNTVQDLVINCDAGQSRSAGVAAALSKILNDDDMDIFKTKPNLNRMVYSRVISGWKYFEGNYGKI